MLSTKHLIDLFWDNDEKKTINGLTPHELMQRIQGQVKEAIKPSSIYQTYYELGKDEVLVPVDGNPNNFWIDNIYAVKKEAMADYKPNLLIWDTNNKLNGHVLKITQSNPFRDIQSEIVPIILEIKEDNWFNLLMKTWLQLIRTYNEKGILVISLELEKVTYRLSREDFYSALISAVMANYESNIITTDSNIVKLHK
jgi:hypothetical protein